MNVVILNTNSFGGNYEYSRCIAAGYVKDKNVTSCVVLIPVNAKQHADQTYKKVLISDDSRFNFSLLRKLYFLYRSIINPLKVFSYLKKHPPSLVLFNDYEQITSIIWAPLFKSLKKKHTFAVILHDPDRDSYLPVKWLSSYTMCQVMRIMDAAFYHEILPIKKYYDFDIPKVKIPHGLYVHETYEVELYNQLIEQKGSARLMGVIGNIRDEKNYSLLIESLSDLPHVKLVIAGSPSNSEVPIDTYKKQIETLKVAHQVIWIEKRLSDDEIQSVIKACDLILLYYKHTFTSQSGILNLIALHKKKLIVSDGRSALTQTVHKFQIGQIVSLDKDLFVAAVGRSLEEKDADKDEKMWLKYIEFASWEKNIEIVLEQMQMLQSAK